MWEHGFSFCIFSKKSGTCYCFEVLSHAEKKAEKESDQKDGETHALWMFTDLYMMQYIKKTCADIMTLASCNILE